MNNTPLVSIPVITYNSSEYIIEGLESIKNQTYKNIELVISDDCSTDNTVEICQKWLDDNKSYFKRAIIVTTDKNTGVAGNLNRAIRECHGEWIKTLSGDDKFLPYTIQGYIEYLQSHPECNIAFAKLKMFGDDSESVQSSSIWYEKFYYPKIRLDRKRQYKQNLIKLFVPGPGLFYKKSLWEDVCGYDERYQFCEEDPFMFKIYNKGYTIDYINVPLYGYRINPISLCRNTSNKGIIRPLRDSIKFFRDVRRKSMIKNGLILYAYDETIRYNCLEYKEKDETFKWIVFKFLQFLSPITILSIIKKHLGKDAISI